MLWQYTQLIFAVAGVATILSFHKNIERIGQVFFMLVGGVSWMAGAASLLKINFRWAGANNVVSYTYIPSTESPFIFLFGAMGLLLFLIGIIRAMELTYGPVVDYTGMMLGKKTKPYQDL